MKRFIWLFVLCIAAQTIAADRISVALVDLQAKGVSSEEASAFTDRIREELFKTGQYTVMDRSVMDKILAERGLEMSGLVASEGELVQAGKLLGVQWIIVGSVSKVGNMYSISLRSIDVKTGVVLNIASTDYDGSIEGAARTSCPLVVTKLVGGKVKKSHKWLWITGGILVVGGGAAAAMMMSGDEGSTTPSNNGNIVIEVPANP